MAHFLCHLGCSHFGALLLDFYFTENINSLLVFALVIAQCVFRLIRDVFQFMRLIVGITEFRILFHAITS